MRHGARGRYFNDAHTPAWYETRHAVAQTFLDRFVRQNIAEIDEIPWREQATRVRKVRRRGGALPTTLLGTFPVGARAPGQEAAGDGGGR